MHYQVAPHEEAKLVRCTRGAIYDVVIDLRPESPTFKQWLGLELTERNRWMLYVPERFAHGYQTLEDDTEVFYQITEQYEPGCAKGIPYDDPAFAIRWIIDPTVIGERDRQHLPFLSQM